MTCGHGRARFSASRCRWHINRAPQPSRCASSSRAHSQNGGSVGLTLQPLPSPIRASSHRGAPAAATRRAISPRRMLPNFLRSTAHDTSARRRQRAQSNASSVGPYSSKRSEGKASGSIGEMVVERKRNTTSFACRRSRKPPTVLPRIHRIKGPRVAS